MTDNITPINSNLEIQFYNPCYEKPTKGVYTPPLNRDFTALDVKNIDDKTMLKIMGKEGKVFKAISHQTGVDYIFWLKDEGLIAIWGYSDSLPYAIQRLQMRIYLILSQVNLYLNYDMNFPVFQK
jgi:hypothetical protein